jgi:hypothetical protein
MMINQTELQQLMLESASEAVQYAAEKHQQHLDFTKESASQLDEILTKLHHEHKNQAISKEHLFTLSYLFGAYLGQIFQQKVGGEWAQLPLGDDNSPVICLCHHDKEFPFASVCYNKIVNDASLSLSYYLNQALHNATQ